MADQITKMSFSTGGSGGGTATLPDNLVYSKEEEKGVQIFGIVDLVYPVGSIYMSVNDASPAVLFGGTWEQIGQGRTLFGAGNGYTAGTTVEAGLPNITGTLTRAYGEPNMVEQVGAFHKATNGAYKNGMTTNWQTNYGWGFDASKSNPIYGNSETVQPPAFVVYMWQRTA